MVFACEGVVIVEMAVPANRLAVFRIRHFHVSRHDFIVLLGKCNDSILCVVVTPSRDEYGILVVIFEVVVCCIVNREQCPEHQTLQELVHVVVDTSIELELTADGPCLTTEVAVGNGIGLSSLCAAREILSVEQVQRLAKNRECLAGIRVDHVDGNQRSCVLGEVWTHRSCITPEVTLVLIGIVERGAHVGKTSHELVYDQVHITTYAKAFGEVFLCRAEVQQVFEAIVVDVRVEVGTCTATLNLQRTFRTIVNLAEILVRIVVYIGIAIRIQARSVVVDVLLGIFWSESVVCTRFVVERHVFSRSKILRECLGDMEAGVGICIDLQAVDLSALGGNQDGTFGTLGTIENHGLCTLEEGHLLNFRR